MEAKLAGASDEQPASLEQRVALGDYELVFEITHGRPR